jgi:hypothetical protein
MLKEGDYGVEKTNAGEERKEAGDQGDRQREGELGFRVVESPESPSMGPTRKSKLHLS